MRAPVQKTRPRRKDKQTALTGDAQQTPTVGKGRPTHVRNRLVVAVAVVAAAIAGAGAPSVLAASQQLHDSQELVTLAERTQDALTLAHSLADERDEVVPYIAAGRPEDKAPSEEQSARVDRQVEELRADEDTSQALRDELDAVAAVRRAALTGKSGPLEAHQAYSDAITQLHKVAARLADATPPRAGSGAHALTELDTAVQQAAATRGLLLAALNVPSSTETVIDPVTGLPVTSDGASEEDEERRDELSAAALLARVRSDAALADFRDAAPKAARASYDSTVTGPEVDTADKYLEKLTDKPTLSDGEVKTSPKKLAAALSARIEMMRGVEASLFEQRTTELAGLRDEDVTELEIRIAILGALLLLSVGVATAMARTLTRPLSVLRRGSARLAEAEDPAAEEPVTFTGRNDEFAQVVRSVNALHAHAAGLGRRIATLEADRKHLVGQRQKMADAREELCAELAEATAHMERMRHSIGGTFVNLALRTLGLVERQLGVIEGLEEREDDPDRLATLFKLDHFATVMRRTARTCWSSPHGARPAHGGSGPAGRRRTGRGERDRAVRAGADRGAAAARAHRRVRRRRPVPPARRTHGERHRVLPAGHARRGLRLADGERRGDALRPGRGHRHGRGPPRPAQHAALRVRPGGGVRRGSRVRRRSRPRPVRRRPARPPARGAGAAAQAEAGRDRRGGRPAGPAAGAGHPHGRSRVRPGRRPHGVPAGRRRGGQLQRPARPRQVRRPPGRPGGTLHPGPGGSGGVRFGDVVARDA